MLHPEPEPLVPGGMTVRIAMPASARVYLQRRHWTLLAVCVVLAVMPVAVAAFSDPSSTHDVVTGLAIAVPIVLAGDAALLWFDHKIVLDLRNGTIARYTGPWEERVVRSQTDYVELRLPDRRRRVRSSRGSMVVAARRAGLDREWRAVHGHVDFVESSSLAVDVERTSVAL